MIIFSRYSHTIYLPVHIVNRKRFVVGKRKMEGSNRGSGYDGGTPHYHTGRHQRKRSASRSRSSSRDRKRRPEGGSNYDSNMNNRKQ